MRFKKTAVLSIVSLILFSFPVYSNQQRDTKRVGGADRGNCNIAEMPKTIEIKDLIAISTRGEMIVASDNPSFWFYSPYQSATPIRAKFTLRNEKEEFIAEPFNVELPSQTGIFQVKPPVKLLPNTSYRWYFSVVCDAARPSKNPRVQGWVRYVPLSPEQAKELMVTKDFEAKASKYQQIGFWNDALTILATNQTSDVVNPVWKKLLDLEDLVPMTAQPILACCALEQLQPITNQDKR